MINKSYITLFIFFVTSISFAQKLAKSGDFYRLKNIIPVEGRQGIAADDEFYYVSSSTALYKYTKDGELVGENKNPFKHISKEVNHLGDIDVNQGEIITGVEHFDAGKVKNIQIAIYNTNDLSFKKAIEFKDMEQPEVAGVTVDKEKNIAWMVDWTEGYYIYKYDLETEEYLGKVHLQPSPQWQQGAFFIEGGELLITADDGDADLEEPDNIYITNLSNTNKTTAEVYKFREMNEFERTGEIEGISIDPITHDLLVLNNRGAIIKKGMPSGFYPDYEEEIHEVYVFERLK